MLERALARALKVALREKNSSARGNARGNTRVSARASDRPSERVKVRGREASSGDVSPAVSPSQVNPVGGRLDLPLLYYLPVSFFTDLKTVVLPALIVGVSLGPRVGGYNKASLHPR